MTVLVTGGAGFIGSHFVRHMRRTYEHATVVNVDALTYAGNLDNIADLTGDPKHVFMNADIRNGEAMTKIMRQYAVDEVVNFAAESHVDRSIHSAREFVSTNVGGTLALLEAAQAAKVRRFVQVSTDEVYGSLGPRDPAFTEKTPVSPRNPYAASKAAADHMALAFHETHGLDAVVTRCGNNYGTHQFPEKLIPLLTLAALDGKPLPIHGDGEHVRDWIHVTDHCAAVDAVRMAAFVGGRVFNIGSRCERTVNEVAALVCLMTGADSKLITHVEDRPGVDRRYAMDTSKLDLTPGIDWSPRVPFVQGLAETVKWYRENRAWAAKIEAGGPYRELWDRMPKEAA